MHGRLSREHGSDLLFRNTQAATTHLPRELLITTKNLAAQRLVYWLVAPLQALRCNVCSLIIHQFCIILFSGSFLMVLLATLVRNAARV